jgi:hypothetical protein
LKGISDLSSYYTGWLLPDQARHKLLAMFPPLFPEVVAHHITYEFPAKPMSILPSATEAQVFGYATDGVSLECLVVAIEGTTERPDGKTYHITWSLDREKGGRPFKSNLVLARQGFERVYPPITIPIIPQRFETE